MSPTTGSPGASRPSGNASTSVGPTRPRYREFTLAIASGPRNVTETSARWILSDVRVAATSARTRALRSGSRASVVETSTCISPLFRDSVSRVVGVRLDDLTHEAVANDVRFAQILEADAIDSLKNPLDLHQSGFLASRQIDLSLIARDDSLRVNSEPRQEHLHLRVGCILCLVEDDECIGERAAAHVGERCDLYRPRLERLLYSLVRHHVLERVVKRTKIRIHFCLEIAREKAKALAGFNGWTRENYAANAFPRQRIHCGCDCEVRLPSARRSDANDNVVVGD